MKANIYDNYINTKEIKHKSKKYDKLEKLNQKILGRKQEKAQEHFQQNLHNRYIFC
jgi:hypothetical protein